MGPTWKSRNPGDRQRFDPKKAVQSRDLQIKSERFIKYHKTFHPKYKKSAKICEKNVFYTLLFVLSERIDDSFEKAGDLVCIWETPG